MDDFNSLMIINEDDFNIDNEVSFEQAVENISNTVDKMLNENPELLFSYLYRLDVDESKIKKALSPLSIEAPHRGLARLILKRQQQRIKTRLEYSSRKQN